VEVQIRPATAPLLTNARHATAKDGSTTGSGGKNDYQMETEGGKWELERNDPKEVQEQVWSGCKSSKQGLSRAAQAWFW